MYVCVYIYIRMYDGMHIMYACVYVQNTEIYMCICKCTCIDVRMCMIMCICKCICTCMHVYTYTYTCRIPMFNTCIHTYI